MFDSSAGSLAKQLADTLNIDFCHVAITCCISTKKMNYVNIDFIFFNSDLLSESTFAHCMNSLRIDQIQYLSAFQNIIIR